MAKAVVSDEEEEVELDEEEREEDGDRGDGRDADEDEDEEDEEGQDEYEKDGFIVDDVDEEGDEEEEERADSDEEKQKKKKRKKKEDFLLDEDDYELLQDNNVIPRRKDKKFKRLKKAQRHNGEESSGFSDEDEFSGSGKTGRTAEEKVKRSLFDGDEGALLEDVAEDDELVGEEIDGDIGDDDDEMADFIDDEEFDEHGKPVRRKKENRKKFRQGQDNNSIALNEAHDIFGDVEDLLQRRKQVDAGEWKERKLEDEFEPVVLSEKFMTENDDHIRELDVPERMQILEENTGSPPLDEISTEDESSWIYNQLACGAMPLFGKSGFGFSKEGQDLPINRDDIIRFLDLHHVQKLDIPFIATYRKEECLSLLKDPDVDNQDKSEKTPALKWHKVLWAIQNLDRKWLLLQKRKSALQHHYSKRFEEDSRRDYHETRLALNQQIFESIMKSLKAAESEREIDDVDAKFNLHFPPGEVYVDDGQFRRPSRSSHYNTCSKAGLWEVSSKFGYSSEQFGLQLSLEKMRMDELEDAKEPPEKMASRFTCAMYKSPQDVLSGARHMAAVEISCEPCVKKYVRSYYLDNAVVSTCPTLKGKRIDSFHEFFGVMWLREKPLSKFEDAQWLLVQKAEDETLLQVTIKLPEEKLNKLTSDFNEYYLSDGVSKYAQLWNEQRKLILKDALFKFLLPSMEKEAKSSLTSRAKHWLVMEYGKGLWSKVSMGPYQKKDNDINSDDEAAPRVMACCWGPGKPATTFVMLDSSGEVLDVLYAGSLTERSQDVPNQQRKKNDQQKVLKFMTDHQPHVVVLGAVNLSCTRLKDDIYEIIFKMVEENPRDVGHDMDGLSIVYGDESLPRLYENSRVSSDQLPGQQGIVKRAVALGRFLQNPLAMVATLCGPAREILSWKLTSQESFLTPDEKYGMVEQIMVDITNQVGIDINLAVSHEWLFGPLQFVSGLGPRKAASLQRSLVRSGAIFTRKDFVTTHGLGKKVFVNAVGFLRVRRSGLATSSSQFIDLLDDTRIHPESYALAQELAKDVYDEDGANDDDDALEMAIEHVRDRPSVLKSLEVVEYAKSKNRENKIETFYDIKRELMLGFQDRRKQYEEPSQDEEFYMISGETADTLAEGFVVHATVKNVLDKKAICSLDSGLTGILMKEDYSDDWRDISELSERLHKDDVVLCKIKSIQKNRYQLFLVCRESEMRNNRHQNGKELDPYFHEDLSSQQSEKDESRKEKERVKKHFRPRMIVHPRFQNITADDAMKFLSDKDAGESIIRPSLRGHTYLTLTLKVYDGVYAHKDIHESGKEHKDITSLLRLGKTLKIGDDTFEDLDEVMDRYVDPLVANLKTMLNYRKFKRGTKAEVDEVLKVEKAEYPMRIVYCFGISHEHPGTFILTYIRSSNPHHEYIGLYPKGFKFRKRMFEDIDRLVAYFQRHIDDAPPDSTPSLRSVAAMVPMRSPAAGGSSGGWGGGGGGGWRDQSSDRDHTSTPSSRSGRGDFRQGGHPSGAPRPYGGGRGGRGRGRGNSQDSGGGYDAPKWDSGSKDSGGWGSGGGSGWGSSGRGGWNNNDSKNDGGGGWGSGGKNDGGEAEEAGTSGWGSDAKKKPEGGNGWGGGGGWGS